MFYYLNGPITERGLNYIVLDIGGIGYELTVSVSCLEHLSNDTHISQKVFV